MPLTQDKMMECILEDNRGIYLPQAFSQLYHSTTNGKWSGVKKADLIILESGPDNEDYWEAWETVLNNAKFTDKDGVWTLHQDNDLFLVHEDYNWDEE